MVSYTRLPIMSNLFYTLFSITFDTIGYHQHFPHIRLHPAYSSDDCDWIDRYKEVHPFVAENNFSVAILKFSHCCSRVFTVVRCSLFLYIIFLQVLKLALSLLI